MSTRVPPGLSAPGSRLWRSIADEYDLAVHEELLLLEACRCADRLDRLAKEGQASGLTSTNARGDLVSHPCIVEARQQQIVLTRLLASLRLPVGDEDDVTRPQRRGGARGAYGIRGAV